MSTEGEDLLKSQIDDLCEMFHTRTRAELFWWRIAVSFGAACGVASLVIELLRAAQ